jgi:adenylate kinase family enzyme
LRQHLWVRRVSVVGNAGSGKSMLAKRIAATLAVPHIEIDAINHLPGWQELDRSELRDRVDELTTGDGWVVDGNYRECVVDGPVWARADTVVWLDLPRRAVMRQVVARTVRRVVTRQELWNGNREPLRNLWAWDPSRSIIRWAWTQHGKYADRYGSAMTSPTYAHLDFFRLTSHADAEELLAGLDEG